MNSKELFEKIQSSLTEALNKEDGIMLGGKKLTFHQHEDMAEEKIIYTDSDCVEVHVYNRLCSKIMWYIDVYNAFYDMSAVNYSIEELEKTFSQERPIISQNSEFSVEDAFQIAITFDENQIKDS